MEEFKKKKKKKIGKGCAFLVYFTQKGKDDLFPF
jgi:hypothetical protein